MASQPEQVLPTLARRSNRLIAAAARENSSQPSIPSTTIENLPDETLLNIFRHLFRPSRDPLARIDFNAPFITCPDLAVLQSNRRFRRIALQALGEERVFSAKAENLQSLKVCPSPDLLFNIRTLHLRTTTLATCNDVLPYNVLRSITNKWAGPGILARRMPMLETYFLEVNLQGVLMEYLTISDLLFLRGDMVTAYQTCITFRQYDYRLSLRGRDKNPKLSRQSQCERSWTVTFPAHSKVFEIKREVHVTSICQKRGRPHQVCGAIFFCEKCREFTAEVHDPRPRVICSSCGLGVYCSQACLHADSRRHGRYNCGFRLLTLGELSTPVRAGRGYVCSKITTIWGSYGTVMELIGNEIKYVAESRIASMQHVLTRLTGPQSTARRAKQRDACAVPASHLGTLGIHIPSLTRPRFLPAVGGLTMKLRLSLASALPSE